MHPRLAASFASASSSPAPGRPEIRSVVISDKTHFVSVIGPVEPLWQDMVNAYARLPKVT